MAGFTAACSSGDLSGLLEVLAPDAWVMSISVRTPSSRQGS
jgi:hypothetical protein